MASDEDGICSQHNCGSSVDTSIKKHFGWNELTLLYGLLSGISFQSLYLSSSVDLGGSRSIPVMTGEKWQVESLPLHQLVCPAPEC